MVKCANCSAEAEYTYVLSAEELINYCEDDVPNFLKKRKAAGQLALIPIQIKVEAPVAPEVDAPSKSSKKKTVEPVEEETPAEPEVETPTEPEAE